MNPMYGTVPPGSGYMGPKLGIGSYHAASYSAAFPPGGPSYPQAVYASSGATYPTDKGGLAWCWSPGSSCAVPAFIGFSPGTPYKVPPPASGAPPPYTPTPSHYQHPSMYPVRGGTYPPQGLYPQGSYLGQPMLGSPPPHVIQQTTLSCGAYFAQPVYAAAAAAAAASQPHVIHHTTVVQPNSLHTALYPPPAAPPRPLPVLTGAAMAMTGTLLAAPPPGAVGGPGVAMPTYRPPGPPTYGYAAPHW